MQLTRDNGRTWKNVWTCSAKVQLGGLSRQIKCNVGQLDFVNANVGYAAVHDSCFGMGCGPPPLIAKTTDGGVSWQATMGPGVAESDKVVSVRFLDERTGFAWLSSKKLQMTTDGGETWRGIVASPGEAMQFADPSVGWGMVLDRTDTPVSFTTDGGNRWITREVRLPTTGRAYSLPRRDRAYIVGDNGMVFRYRVVPASHPLGKNDIAAPAMPGFDSPLDEQVQQLEKVVSELTTAVAAGAAGAPAGAATAGTAGDPTGGGSAGGAGGAAGGAGGAGSALDAPLAPPSAYTTQCCKKSFNQLEVILGALSTTLPEFIGKYRNLNLLLAALRMGAELPGQYRSVKDGLSAFRKSDSKEAAQAALAAVSAALSAFKQTTAVSMQQQLPPVQP